MERIRHAARRSLPLAVLVPAAALTAAGPSPASENGGSSGEGAKPTVVLVHGAWADDSGGKEVIRSLRAEGHPVVATANPLRGLTGDSAYLAARLKTIEGPVVLAGHSYGGAVITNAAAHDARPGLAATGAADRAAVLGGAAALPVAGGTALVVRSRRA
ncbi:alpha/beta fold hydrolase [Streptomyces sp. NPDC059454]|jgi:pimeloyl-ACP methyl ester carboxylesterase|uniref:alpha/beta fold hydrolase n=1 Tax=Streptomyces sp. NPDC059454 TaxID=3346836 RepID=UPI0036A8D907